MKTDESNPNNKNDSNHKKDENNKGNEQAKSNAGSNAKHQKKGLMGKNKKMINWTIATAIPILLIGGAVFYFTQIGKPKFEELRNEKTELKSQLNKRDSLINEWVATFNEVEKDLREIRGKEQNIEYKFDSVEYPRNRSKELLGEIEKINQLLEKNREKISVLNRKLEQSGVKIAALENKISNLEATISSRDSSINALRQVITEKNNQIASLNDEVDEMEYDLNEKNRTINEKDSTINQKNRVIDKQTEQLQKAFLAYGSYQELNEKGVLTKDGGFLWFGRNTKLKEDVSNEKFREINIMKKTTVPLNSKKAELVTNHPEGSYKFVKDSTQRIAYLKIEDPLEFWKITNYAVLETTK
jgi:chromosome segregation ATPase